MRYRSSIFALSLLVPVLTLQGCLDGSGPVAADQSSSQNSPSHGNAIDSYVSKILENGELVGGKGGMRPVLAKPEVPGEGEVADVEWPAEALAKGAAYTNWVQNLSVTTTTSCPALQGRITIDLNRGAGGKYIYLCYGKDDGIADSWGPIKNIRVYAVDGSGAPPGMSSEGCSQINVNTGECIAKFIKAVNGSNGDFNQGAGGWYVMMRKRYTNIYPDLANKRTPTEDWPTQVRLNDLAIIYGGNSGISCPSGYLKDVTDLNYGAGGSFIYLCEKFQPFAY